MLAILSLFLVLTLSVLVTRIATVALVHTGLSRESARFQARSAFTGVGFTTDESEKVVRHPVRRRVLLVLMLLGNAGVVTAVSSLILTFVAQDQGASLTLKIVVLIAGVVVLWSIASSQWIDRRLSYLIDKALKRYTQLDVKDYASLLHLSGEYRVSELQVKPEDWLAEQTLGELGLRDEGVLVLGVERSDGTFIGTPAKDTRLVPDDVLVVYGRVSALSDLDRRRKNRLGEKAHKQAIRSQEAVHRHEKEADPTEDR